jgi:hypothetical protein
MYKEMSALEAKYEAQKLAFGPFYFQAVVAMRDLGILDEIRKSKTGISQLDLSQKLGLTEYGLSVLLEAGIAANVVHQVEDGRFKLTKVGVFLKSDELTNVNINFTKDVCYDGLKYLKESVVESRPAGLDVFGKHKTVYHALASLSEDVRKSWFDFDHYYSSDSSPYALDIVFSRKINHLMDIGGNTGKWTIQCCDHDADVHVSIVDLPGQIESAQKNLSSYDFLDRVSYHPCDILLDQARLPKGADVIWMSQFLDCFSSVQILAILDKVHQTASSDTDIYIMESFWDNQKYEAGSYSIIALSLYFTCIANGNSKMFKLDDLLPLIDTAGFEITEKHELIGNTFNTLLKLKKR